MTLMLCKIWWSVNLQRVAQGVFMMNKKKMSESHIFLSNLSSEEKKGVAKLAGCSLSTLRLVWTNCQRPSVRLAKAIEKVTKGRAKKEDLRPDIDWSLIVD